jgi:malate synthase
MEDAASAEISRVQIWQWREHGVKTADDGITIHAQRIRDLVQQQETSRYAGGKWKLAAKLVSDLLTANELDDFLTSAVCYPYIVVIGNDDLASKL